MAQLLRRVSILGIFVAALAILGVPTTSFAHVSVQPTEVAPGAYQTFTTVVPNEKDMSVNGVRLLIPEGVKSVTPTAKQGWVITTKKSGGNITEVTWTGGVIDVGLRDEFTFSAQAPADGSEIIWKAYETYQDGSVVSWDQKPTDDHGKESEDESKGPYSSTALVENTEQDESTDSSKIMVYALSGIAVVISAVALLRTIKR